MKRFVWILAMILVLLVIAAVTLIEWSQPATLYQKPEHLSLEVNDKGA